MLSKQQKYIQRRWIQNKLDLAHAARRFGYKGNNLSKGMQHIRAIMEDMHLAV